MTRPYPGRTGKQGQRGWKVERGKCMVNSSLRVREARRCGAGGKQLTLFSGHMGETWVPAVRSQPLLGILLYVPLRAVWEGKVL